MYTLVLSYITEGNWKYLIIPYIANLRYQMGLFMHKCKVIQSTGFNIKVNQNICLEGDGVGLGGIQCLITATEFSILGAVQKDLLLPL